MSMPLEDLVLAGLVGLIFGGLGIVMAATIALRVGHGSRSAYGKWRHHGASAE